MDPLNGAVAVVGGCGHVGLPLGLAFADAGLDVVLYDINEASVRVLNLVVGQGLRLVVAGLVIGIALSIAMTGVLANYLFDTKPTDTLTYAAVCLTFVLVASMACLAPAMRANWPSRSS